MGNRIIHLLCFCFILLPFVSRAQSTDERLFEELKKKVQLDSYYDSALVYKSGGEAIRLAQKMGDKGKEAEIHIFYGNYFYYSQNFKKAEEEFNKAYYLAYNGNNTKVLRLARIRLTYLEETEGKTEEAELHFQSILEEAKQEKDPANEIECYNALALISERNNKSDEAMKNYLNGLRTAEENKLDYYTAVLLNNIGLLKLNSDKTQEALADFERGLEITNRINNPRLGGHIQNNIGLVYLRLNKTDEGLSHFKAAVQYAHAINHPKELAVAFINYSSVLLQVKRSDESIAYLDSAIQVLESNNMKFELSKALLGKAQVMVELKNYNEAIHLASEAREVALMSKNLEDRAFSHRVLYRVYEKMNLFELALKEYKTYRDLDDSLKETRSNRMFNELQVEYDVEKKEYQLEQEKNKSLLLESENQLKKVRIRILIFASVAILILLFIVFYIRNQRNIRKEQERFSQQLIANLEKERSRIARDLHDDIGQSLSAVKSRLNILGRNGEENLQSLEEEVGKVIEQTREISRNLYPSYLEKIGLIRSIARLMEMTQSGTGIECSFDVCNEIEEISPENKTHLYRIIQECVTNTTRHSGASALKISIEKSGEHCLFTYRDNGKGIGNQEEIRGIGFLSIRERVKMLKGELQLSDNQGKGFRLIIKFNLERISNS